MKEFRGGRLAFQSDEHEGGGYAASVRSRGFRRQWFRPVAVAGAAGAAGAPAAAASAIRGDCRRMDGGCAARGSPCSETSAHYGASDARDGARVTLRVPPVYSRGGHLGVAPGVLERGYLGVAPGVLEGPRYRGSGPLWMTAARQRFRASADRGGGDVHSWARQTCPVTLRNARVCRHS